MGFDTWSDVKLGDIAADSKNALVGGPFGSNLTVKDFAPEGVPVIQGRNMGRRWVEGNFVFVSEEKASSLSANIARPGDVIFTQRGTLGQTSIIPAGQFDRYVVSQSQMKLTPDPTAADPMFIYYLFHSPQQLSYVESNAIRGGVPHTNLTILRNTPLKLPPLDVQRCIAGVLSSFDNKIEGNARFSKALEQIARALFKSWFVDFDPVRGTSTVPEDVRRLFPDSLVDSRIGLVPDGWDVVPLGQCVEVTRGLSYTGAGLADEGMPLHNLNSIREGGGYKEEGIKYYVGEYRERDVVEPGDVIVANTDLTQNGRVIGSPALVPRWFGEEGLYSHHIYRLRPRAYSSLTARWLYLLLVGYRMHQQVVGFSNGTTVNMLPKDGIEKQVIAVPPPEIVERFETTAAPMFEQGEVLAEESRTLVELRDTLLPRLISGEVRIRLADEPSPDKPSPDKPE
jgi:type I restriction enzyme S subunit